MKKIKTAIATALLGVSTLAFAAINCPIDGMSMYFTGKTKTEMGKLLKQYKCASGHITWVVG